MTSRMYLRSLVQPHKPQGLAYLLQAVEGWDVVEGGDREKEQINLGIN